MIERQKHLDAFEYFIGLGGTASDANIEKTGGKWGVSPNTIWRWYKEFNWRDKTIIRLTQARKKAEEDGILDAEAKTAAFLAICEERIKDIKVRRGYIGALYAAAKEMIEQKKLKIESIHDLIELAKIQNATDKEEQSWIKTAQLLMGEPDSRADQMGNVLPGVVIVGIDGSKYSKAFVKDADVVTVDDNEDN